MLITLTQDPVRVIRMKERLEALEKSLNVEKSHEEQKGALYELGLLNRLLEAGKVDTYACLDGLHRVLGPINTLVYDNRRSHVITMNGGTE